MRSFSSWKTPLFSAGLLVAAAVYLSSLGVRSTATAEPSDRSTKAAKTFPTMSEMHRFRGGYLWLIEERETKEHSLGVGFQNILKQLKSGKVRTREDAIGIAISGKVKRAGGLAATEFANVVSLIRVGVNSPKFVAKGDLVWVVQISSHLDGMLISQEAWINARTGEIRWMLPFEGLNYESPPSDR